MKKIVILLVVFVGITSVAGCAETTSVPETPEVPDVETTEIETVQELTTTPEVIEILETAENPVENTARAIAWLVPPSLDYKEIWYCCMCDVFAELDANGALIDKITGELQQRGHGGHGSPFFPRWVYDEERGLFGRAGTFAKGSAVEVFPIDEFAQRFPENINDVHVVYLADSSERFDDMMHGGEGLTPEAYKGKCALARGNVFITDFIYGNESFINGIEVSGSFTMVIDGKYGIIDEDGDVIVPFDFDDLRRIDKSSAFAKFDGKYGIISVS